MIEIKKMAAGISFDVRVKTQAGKTTVVGKYGGRMKITVKSPPEKGRANEEVVECISDFLNIPKSQVSIKYGHTSQNKCIFVATKNAVDIINRINNIGGTK